MAKKWYVLHTKSGNELKAKVNIENMLKQLKLEDKVSEILIPTEDVVEIRKGEKKVSKKKFFPGYILINMEMDEDILKSMLDIPAIMGFVGSGKTPSPLSDNDVKNILVQMGKIEGKVRAPRPRQTFKIGQNVRITEGPFENFLGKVIDFAEDRGRVKVMVTIFDRQTPVELDFAQVGAP